MGNDSVYVKTKTFDPFPFPSATPQQRQIIGDLAEELDVTRKDVLAEHSDLTLTGLYNLRDKVKAGTPLDMVEQDQRRRGRSEEHTSELQSLMRNSYAVFCLKKKKNKNKPKEKISKVTKKTEAIIKR